MQMRKPPLFASEALPLEAQQNPPAVAKRTWIDLLREALGERCSIECNFHRRSL